MRRGILSGTICGMLRGDVPRSSGKREISIKDRRPAATVLQNMEKPESFALRLMCARSPPPATGHTGFVESNDVPTSVFHFLQYRVRRSAPPFIYKSKSDRNSYKSKIDRNTAAKNQSIPSAVSRNVRAGNADTEFRGTTKTRRSEFRFPTITRQPPLRR